MEEIKVGEYIRSKDGLIGKVEQIGNSLFWIEDGTAFSLQDKSIKHSKNILDLIEVGDIVEWKFKDSSVICINEVIQRPETGKTLGVYAEEDDCLIPLEYIDILKILTHEQFEENCYRLGE